MNENTEDNIMRVCRKCNASIEDDMSFCPECGVKYIKYDSQFYTAPNIPIAIAEQCIFFDEGSVLGSLSLCNIGEKEVSACAVKIKCMDSFGDELADCVVKYSDLMADYGEFFGEDKVFTFNDPDTRQIQIVIDKVLFADNTMIKGDSAEFSPTNEYDDLKTYLEASKEDILREQEMEKVWNKLLDWHNKFEHQEFTNDKLREEKNNILLNYPDFMIPSYVTEIPKALFTNVSVLKSITLPDSITKINIGAFNYCKNLQNIKLSENLTELGMTIFTGCDSLKSIVLPDSLTTIHKNAFFLKTKSRYNGAMVTLTSSINKIYASASVMNLLKAVELPNNCMVIDKKVLEEKARKEMEAQEAKQRIENYCEEHSKEKQQLDAEKEELGSELASLEKSISAIEREIGNMRQSLDSDAPQNE